MYVNRPEHERALRKAIKTGYNIVIFGDSGCGKSWLYKKVFLDDGIFFDVLDFNNASTDDDVDLQILELLADYEEWRETERAGGKSLEIKPQRVGVSGNRERKFVRQDASPFQRLLEAIRHAAGRKRAFIVFENLEYILNKPEIISRIQSMLLALDDPRFGSFRVQICLVGVPSEIKEILSDGNKYQTISNRVYEIPEVGRLRRKMVDLLITRGLEQELDYTIESKTFCCGKIAFVTYQTPQYIHDVCLHVAFRAEEAFNRINPDLIDVAVEDWILSNSRQGIEFIRGLVMSDRSVRKSRAKILYAISRLEAHFFSSKEINDELSRNFPQTLSEGRIQTLAMLRKLTEGEERLLKCDADRQLFRVATPLLRSGLRVCLKLNQKEEEVSVKAVGKMHT